MATLLQTVRSNESYECDEIAIWCGNGKGTATTCSHRKRVANQLGRNNVPLPHYFDMLDKKENKTKPPHNT